LIKTLPLLSSPHPFERIRSEERGAVQPSGTTVAGEDRRTMRHLQHKSTTTKWSVEEVGRGVSKYTAGAGHIHPSQRPHECKPARFTAETSKSLSHVCCSPHTVPPPPPPDPGRTPHINPATSVVHFLTRASLLFDRKKTNRRKSAEEGLRVRANVQAVLEFRLRVCACVH
jgi:hypothetical protein